MGSVPVQRKKRADVTDGPQTFRSPTAVIIWWVWVLFALANLIDLAVQGRDHESLVAAAILLLATGVAYVTAQRPRIVADKAGVTVLNPLRDHRVGWANVTKVDMIDLLRLHCQRGQDNIKIVSAWAVHYSRRRKLTMQAKASRQAARGSSGRAFPGSFGMGGFGGDGRLGSYPGTSSAAPASTAEAEAERIAGLLREYATAARAETVWAEGTAPADGTGPADGTVAESPTAAEPAAAVAETPAPAATAAPAARDPRLSGWLEPLRSSWSNRAILALVIPALLLVIAIFV